MPITSSTSGEHVGLGFTGEYLGVILQVMMVRSQRWSTGEHAYYVIDFSTLVVMDNQIER
jgi:hypothetical protein